MSFLLPWLTACGDVAVRTRNVEVPYRVYVPLNPELLEETPYAGIQSGPVKNRQLADALDQCQVVVKKQAAQLDGIRKLQPDQAE